MAKKGKIAPDADVKESPVAQGSEATSEAKAPAAPKSRGPRGTEETAKITVLAKENPKRANSKAFATFSQYRDGMTIKEFADIVGKEATSHLVYDAKHGFITIDGYDPGEVVQPKPKAEPKPKAGKKVKAEANPDVEAAKESLAQETVAETME